MPSVSVIIPNYNHATFLKQRIDSILNQSYKDFEVIILDDCSTDNSREIIESYRSEAQVSQIVYNTVNSGSSFRQWEKGIKLAKGGYIWIAESDDFADKEFLQAVTKFLIDPTVTIAYCRTNSLFGNDAATLCTWGEDIRPQLWTKDQLFDGAQFVKLFLRFRNIIPNASAVVFKKNAFEITEEIVNMKYAGDWVVWALLASKGRVAYTARPLNYFRTHINTTRNTDTYQKEKQRIGEYFIAIKSTKKIISDSSFVYSKKYDWILKEWLAKFRSFDFVDSLRPPYPFMLLVKFYFILTLRTISYGPKRILKITR